MIQFHEVIIDFNNRQYFVFPFRNNITHIQIKKVGVLDTQQCLCKGCSLPKYAIISAADDFVSQCSWSF